MKGDKQAGFSIVEAVIIVAIIGIIGVAGWLVYQRHNPIATTTTTQTANQHKSTAPTQAPADPYQGWQTFTDNAMAAASGISIKYPSDWQVIVGNSKAYAWELVDKTDSKSAISVRSIDLSAPYATESPKQEWETCATDISGDACGATLDDKTLSGSESTINGLAAYTATMQSSYGTYHVTVIRSNKATSGGIPFVEFVTYATDQTALSTFAAIMASASFPI